MTTENTAAPAAPAPVATVAGDLIAPAAAAPAAAPVAAAPAPAADAAPAAPALTLPGKEASPEEWAKFYGQLGRPETPDAYEIPVPDGDPGEFAKLVAPILHKANLTAEQAKALATGWNEFVGAQSQAQAAAAAKAEADAAAALNAQNLAEKAALDNEWGPRAAENTELARRAVRQFLPAEKAPDVINALESVLGYKGTIQFLHGIGKGLGEHEAVGLSNKQQPAGERTLAQRMYPNMPN